MNESKIESSDMSPSFCESAEVDRERRISKRESSGFTFSSSLVSLNNSDTNQDSRCKKRTRDSSIQEEENFVNYEDDIKVIKKECDDDLYIVTPDTLNADERKVEKEEWGCSDDTNQCTSQTLEEQTLSTLQQTPNISRVLHRPRLFSSHQEREIHVDKYDEKVSRAERNIEEAHETLDDLVEGQIDDNNERILEVDVSSSDIIYDDDSHFSSPTDNIGIERPDNDIYTSDEFEFSPSLLHRSVDDFDEENANLSFSELLRRLGVPEQFRHQTEELTAKCFTDNEKLLYVPIPYKFNFGDNSLLNSRDTLSLSPMASNITSCEKSKNINIDVPLTEFESLTKFLYKVTFREGCYVRHGLDLLSSHLFTYPCGAIVDVVEKRINQHGLARLRAKSGRSVLIANNLDFKIKNYKIFTAEESLNPDEKVQIYQKRFCDTPTEETLEDEGSISLSPKSDENERPTSGDTKPNSSCVMQRFVVDGWLSECLNPLSGQRGAIVEKIPMCKALVYRIQNPEGAEIRESIDIHSPYVSNIPHGSEVLIDEKSFSNTPSNGCLPRLKLMDGSGWITLWKKIDQISLSDNFLPQFTEASPKSERSAKEMKSEKEDWCSEVGKATRTSNSKFPVAPIEMGKCHGTSNSSLGKNHKSPALFRENSPIRLLSPHMSSISNIRAVSPFELLPNSPFRRGPHYLSKSKEIKLHEIDTNRANRDQNTSAIEDGKSGLHQLNKRQRQSEENDDLEPFTFDEAPLHMSPEEAIDARAFGPFHGGNNCNHVNLCATPPSGPATSKKIIVSDISKKYDAFTSLYYHDEGSDIYYLYLAYPLRIANSKDFENLEKEKAAKLLKKKKQRICEALRSDLLRRKRDKEKERLKRREAHYDYLRKNKLLSLLRQNVEELETELKRNNTTRRCKEIYFDEGKLGNEELNLSSSLTEKEEPFPVDISQTDIGDFDKVRITEYIENHLDIDNIDESFFTSKNIPPEISDDVWNFCLNIPSTEISGMSIQLRDIRIPLKTAPFDHDAPEVEINEQMRLRCEERSNDLMSTSITTSSNENIYPSFSKYLSSLVEQLGELSDTSDGCKGNMEKLNGLKLSKFEDSPKEENAYEREAQEFPTAEKKGDVEKESKIDYENSCLVCYSAPRTATFVHGESGHIACCLECARVLKGRGDPCPVCRCPIDMIIQHYHV